MDDLVQLGVRRHFKKGEAIVEEGRRGDEIFIILSGQVRVLTRGQSGKEADLNICGPGDYIGEMALDGGPRSASVIALEPTECAMVTVRTFREYLEANPEFALRLLTQVIGRLRQATDYLKSISLLDVRGRIRFLLEREARAAGRSGGEWVLPRSLTKQEIANRIGASRAMVISAIRTLEAEHQLRFSTKKVVLLEAFWDADDE